jgi:DNA-binding transcriptional LysR family regulator
MFSMRGVEGFIKTVEAGSFAGAAKILGISPVAVSKNVQRLERELGVRLLHRSTRKLTVTDEGWSLYERCTGPLAELENAQTAVRDKGRSPAGRLRVTSVSPFGRTYVAPLLPAFAKEHPRIEVELHLDDTISDMIAERYDVGIRVGRMKEGTMIAREIAPISFVVCGAPSYLREHGTPRHPKDLARHNCLRVGRPGVARPVEWLLGDRTPVPKLGGNLVSNDIPALVIAAVEGQGLVLAPLPFVLPLFRAGQLLPVLPQHVSQQAHAFLHYPNRKNLPARVRRFVDFMLHHLRRNPDLASDPAELLAPFLRKTR